MYVCLCIYVNFGGYGLYHALFVMLLHVEFGVLMVTCGFSVTASIVVNNCSPKSNSNYRPNAKVLCKHTKSPPFFVVCQVSALKRFKSTTINAFQ